MVKHQKPWQVQEVQAHNVQGSLDNQDSCYTLSGRVTEALPLLERALLELRRPPDIWAASSLLPVWLGEGYVLADRLEEAMQLGQQALEVTRAQKQKGYQAYALRLLGDIAARRTPRRSRLNTSTTRPLPWPGRSACARSGSLPQWSRHAVAKLDQREQARAALATAVDLYCAMDMTFWVPEAKATRRRWKSDDYGGGQSGLAVIHKARFAQRLAGEQEVQVFLQWRASGPQQSRTMPRSPSTAVGGGAEYLPGRVLGPARG